MATLLHVRCKRFKSNLHILVLKGPGHKGCRASGRQLKIGLATLLDKTHSSECTFWPSQQSGIKHHFWIVEAKPTPTSDGGVLRGLEPERKDQPEALCLELPGLCRRTSDRIGTRQGLEARGLDQRQEDTTGSPLRILLQSSMLFAGFFRDRAGQPRWRSAMASHAVHLSGSRCNGL